MGMAMILTNERFLALQFSYINMADGYINIVTQELYLAKKQEIFLQGHSAFSL